MIISYFYLKFHSKLSLWYQLSNLPTVKIIFAERGCLYGMEMDSYKSRFLDGYPDGNGTILYSFLYTWGSRGIPNFWT